jgi:hypothetical protein
MRGREREKKIAGTITRRSKRRRTHLAGAAAAARTACMWGGERERGNTCTWGGMNPLAELGCGCQSWVRPLDLGAGAELGVGEGEMGETPAAP